MSTAITSWLTTSVAPLFSREVGLVAHGQPIARPLRAVDLRAKQIAVISHELRNSLGVVRNAARMLSRQVDAQSVEHARILIDRHVGIMNRHIEDLLDEAPLSRRQNVLQLSHVDLRTILRNSIDANAADVARRGHTLVVSLPTEPLWVHADVGRLEQVFANLLVNAAKYTPDAGNIAVTMERRGKLASVRIRDSGIGIDPAQLSRIFELFVQVDAAAPLAEGGRGIGLAVVRELVEKHGGTVEAKSAGLKSGSEFTVLLPLR